MTPRPPAKINMQIYSEASEWFVTCRSGPLDDAMRRKLDQWLRQSPQHLSAYLELAAVWNEGPELDSQRRWNVETLIAEARTDQGNVVTLVRSESPSPTERDAHRPRRRWMAASIAAAVAGCAVVVWGQLFHDPIYATEIGEQRSIALADGSTVDLNSRSKVRVNYSRHERALELLEGQALFRVAKDRSRPFVVSADGTRVRAVGTQFDVNKKHGGTVVTVVEGQVSVLSNVIDARIDAVDVEVSMPSLPGILLAAGEQITVTDTAVNEITRPDVTHAIAWTQRQLVFEGATLSEVAEEFNRHNRRQLIVQDPELYEFHISGIFASTDPEALLQFLRERAHVHVVETDSAIYLMKNPPAAVTDR